MLTKKKSIRIERTFFVKGFVLIITVIFLLSSNLIDTFAQDKKNKPLPITQKSMSVERYRSRYDELPGGIDTGTIIAIVAVAAVGIALYFILSNDDETSDENDTPDDNEAESDSQNSNSSLLSLQNNLKMKNVDENNVESFPLNLYLGISKHYINKLENRYEIGLRYNF